MTGAVWRVECPAKVNLSLRVGGRLPDGYHEIRTVFQAIDLGDEIEARPAGTLRLTCDGERVPTGPENLVLRAARILRETCGEGSEGADIRLVKRIPVGGGLGGGSSDAAGTLLLLDRLWNLNLSVRALHELGVALGADVPFFLVGGTCSGSGRGERVMPLPIRGPEHVLLGFPPFGISTADVYRRFDAALTPAGKDVSVSRLWAAKLPRANDFALGANDLEGVVFEGWPELRVFRDAMLASGASGAMLSGSGSTVFGVFEEADLLRRAERGLGARFVSWRLRAARSVDHGARIVGPDTRR